ncbi:hypothetical protein QA637_29470 (plasmid) [Sinorhizobium terangae]|nr:hypothetical protein [Sinorhizobium terangae]WFU52075.1 hypothetical protein QA637_29470 [Sinorhizobium terangae]
MGASNAQALCLVGQSHRRDQPGRLAATGRLRLGLGGGRDGAGLDDL